jgi:putative alpha-1,2-mannosidase
LSNIVGKYIHSIVLNYDNNNPSEMGKEILGYVDDLNIHAKQSIDGTHLTNYIDTRRGTNSSGDFSRGNNFPATAMPNGFNFYTPMTNSRDDWLYSYEENNDENNHPTLDGIGISHEPSP